MSVPFRVIDANIKQQFLPFVINPYVSFHSADFPYEQSAAGNGPQYFTFRNTSDTTPSGASAKLNMCPSSYQQYMENDIANKLLFSKDKSASVTVDEILNSLPGIQIREYLPDTALDQCINFFSDLLKNMTNFFKKSVDEATSTNNSQPEAQSNDNNVMKKILNTTWYAMKYITGSEDVDPSILDSVKSDAAKMDMWKDGGHKLGVMQFPFTLYYRLQSCLTTGVYELPAIKDDRIMYHSEGHAGWEGDGLNGGFRLVDKGLDSLPFGLGTVAKALLGNIGISWTPWWDAAKGNATPEPEVSVKFDLFNDTAEAAMMNFIFVNTIVPNNKWIQYGLFQHSPHLYDVKIEGYNRLFACSADFTVKQAGVLRDMPEKWIHKLIWDHGHIDMQVGGFEEMVKTQRLIKVPDVYQVEMKFKSLLPANFNNWMYMYAQNNNHINSEFVSSPYQKSAMSSILSKAVGGLVDGMDKAWDSGASQQYVPDKMKLK